MTPPARALLVCALLLCAAEPAARAQRGHCTRDQCVAVFQELEDFAGAQRSCKDSGGQLYTLSPEHAGDVVPASGRRYWVALPGADPAAEQAQGCPSISVSPGGSVEQQRAPCRSTRNAFLCQYTFEDPCNGLQAGASARVAYTTPMEFRADDSDAFPPGTIALTGEDGGSYPASKHVCASKVWTAAPWSCEVLRGGCEHKCVAAGPQRLGPASTCVCPPGRVLHRNNISCTTGPCEDHSCTGEGEECETTREGFRCKCRDDFVEEDGACVNVAICQRCEHMCNKTPQGVYQCACHKGYLVAAHDPTKCTFTCTEKDCPALCDRNVPDSCFCPDGYIKDVQGGKPICTDIDECAMNQCHHTCVNELGGYRCLCAKGFVLHHDKNKCVSTAVEEEEKKEKKEEKEGEGGGGGSGSGPTTPLALNPSPASARPAAVPSYVKTGSMLGIGVFVMLCAVLLYFVVRHASKRCSTFKMAIKHRDIDIFYLQQVSSETYKRLSTDKLFKSDS